MHKRQYIIEQAKLIDYNDIDITTNDQMLQDCLNENSDVRLKNIVPTIQSEQNKIIRANMFKPLIVQGVAGSGKTTVALHRIAYLVYTYEKTFRPDEFLIIAPNKFFIGGNIKIKNSNDELSKIVREDSAEIQVILNSAKFKSCLKFKKIIDEYLIKLKEDILDEKDFKISEYVIYTHEEIMKILSETLQRNCMKQSVEILSNILQKRVYDKSGELVEKITSKRKEKLDYIEKNINSNLQQKYRKEIFEETEYEISQLLKGGKKLVLDYIKKIKLGRAIDHYKKIITNEEKMLEFID